VERCDRKFKFQPAERDSAISKHDWFADWNGTTNQLYFLDRGHERKLGPRNNWQWRSGNHRSQLKSGHNTGTSLWTGRSAGGRVGSDSDSDTDRVSDSRTDCVSDSRTDRVSDSRADRVSDSRADRVSDSRADRVSDSRADRVSDSGRSENHESSGEQFSLPYGGVRLH
jgi:hypothetical protein